jgi:hypothetical protein
MTAPALMSGGGFFTKTKFAAMQAESPLCQPCEDRSSQNE